ncbi:hypothetical protein SRIMM317S_00658 [Streptomyces rimosus subsp. rimosus]
MTWSSLLWRRRTDGVSLAREETHAHAPAPAPAHRDRLVNLRGLLRRRSPAAPCPACGSTDVLWEDEGVYGAGELLWWCASCLHQWHPGDLAGGEAVDGAPVPGGPVPGAPVQGGPAPSAAPVPPPPFAPPPPPTVPPAPAAPPVTAASAVPPVAAAPPAPGPATVAERVMYAAGLTPLVPCPGAYEPWPCRCSRCGRERQSYVPAGAGRGRGLCVRRGPAPQAALPRQAVRCRGAGRAATEGTASTAA